jgi:hypothetical protein
LSHFHGHLIVNLADSLFFIRELVSGKARAIARHAPRQRHLPLGDRYLKIRIFQLRVRKHFCLYVRGDRSVIRRGVAGGDESHGKHGDQQQCVGSAHKLSL